MRRRLFPNMIGDVIELEERQERMERVMQILGITPDYPYTVNINDGTRNRVMLGLVDGDYGIKIVDNAGNEILLANGTIVADAIKAGTLDCSLITVTNLNAGSITTGTLSASFIQGGTLNAGLITVTNLNAASITVGTFVNINDRLNAQAIHGEKITAGTLNADRIVAGTITADRIVAHVITTDQIAYRNVDGDYALIDASVKNRAIFGDISADKITAGSLNVGGAGQINAIYIKRGSWGNAKIRFEGGSRFWEDDSNDIGLNAVGGDIWFYANSIWRLLISDSGGINVNGYVNCKSIYLNQDQSEGSIYNVDQIKGYNDLRITGNGDVYFYRNDGGGAGVRFQWGTGKIYSYSSSINLGGVDKAAIVPTSQGYNALYCIEAPEVWFMDFCEGKNKIDALFLEVTEPPYHFIKCENGGYQVWGKRKGFAEKRFEIKTREEFYKNNRFWSIPKG